MKHLFYVDRVIYLPCIAVIYWQLKIKMLGVMTSGPTEMKHEVAAVAHQVWLMIFTMNLSASVGDKEMPDESVCIGNCCQSVPVQITEMHGYNHSIIHLLIYFSVFAFYIFETDNLY
jgi:hypothetical protein